MSNLSARGLVVAVRKPKLAIPRESVELMDFLLGLGHKGHSGQSRWPPD